MSDKIKEIREALPIIIEPDKIKDIVKALQKDFDEGMKMCVKCEKIKLFGEFCKDKSRSGGLYCYCKTCVINFSDKRRGLGYCSFKAAKQRCRNKNDESYVNYGARGISFEFLSWEHFLETIGPRPSDRYTLDRINVNGHYEPNNCRWVTWAEQERNKRSNVTNLSEVKEIRKLKQQGVRNFKLAKRFNLPQVTIHNIVNNTTWKLENNNVK